MSKDEVAEILRKRGYNTEVKSGVVTIYYSGELDPISEQVKAIFNEIGYNMSFALTANKAGV